MNNDSEERIWYEQIEARLQTKIEENFPDKKEFFAKTSSRSAKDACIFKRDFLEIYKKELLKFPDSSQENSRIIALLTAAFLSLRLTSATEVLSMFIISERIYQDMLLATEAQNISDSLFKENIILRPFIQIDVDMEFRGFVFQRRLTCLSQYNYLIYSQRLCQWKNQILEKIVSFFNEVVQTKLSKYKSNSYVIDFALTKGGKAISKILYIYILFYFLTILRR